MTSLTERPSAPSASAPPSRGTAGSRVGRRGAVTCRRPPPRPPSRRSRQSRPLGPVRRKGGGGSSPPRGSTGPPRWGEVARPGVADPGWGRSPGQSRRARRHGTGCGARWPSGGRRRRRPPSRLDTVSLRRRSRLVRPAGRRALAARHRVLPSSPPWGEARPAVDEDHPACARRPEAPHAAPRGRTGSNAACTRASSRRSRMRERPARAGTRDGPTSAPAGADLGPDRTESEREDYPWPR